MKNKTAIVIAILVLLVAVLGIKYRARQLSVTPGSLVMPTEERVTDTSSNTATGTTSTPAPAIPPSTKITLTISSPSNGATVTSSSLTIRGKTSANAEVFVNELETKADATGNFSVSMTLDEGENYIIVMANDSAGNVAEAELTVTYAP